VISNKECMAVFGSKYVISSTLCTSGAKSTGTCNVSIKTDNPPYTFPL
jgi:hypothetical protein